MSILIVIPTYNEARNIQTLIPRLRQVAPQADILVVDDNSPDGTGRIVDEMAKSDPAIHALHRTAKEGLGRAYIAGFHWGLERGYERLAHMDADLSHDPQYLPALLAASETHDLALGSRYVPGGGTRNWGLHRRALSRFASFYARTILGISQRDLTGGYRCWQRHALENIDLPTIRSNGYSFMVETLYRAVLRGHSVEEVPIIFVDRVEGQSKMSKKVIVESVGMVWKLRSSAPAIRALRGGVAANDSQTATPEAPVS